MSLQIPPVWACLLTLAGPVVVSVACGEEHRVSALPSIFESAQEKASLTSIDQNFGFAEQWNQMPVEVTGDVRLVGELSERVFSGDRPMREGENTALGPNVWNSAEVTSAISVLRMERAISTADFLTVYENKPLDREDYGASMGSSSGTVGRSY